MEKKDLRLAKMKEEKIKINDDFQARKIVLRNKVNNILESGNYKTKNDIYEKVFSAPNKNHLNRQGYLLYLSHAWQRWHSHSSIFPNTQMFHRCYGYLQQSDYETTLSVFHNKQAPFSISPNGYMLLLQHMNIYFSYNNFFLRNIFK